jgi:hypothetical protein
MRNAAQVGQPAAAARETQAPASNRVVAPPPDSCKLKVNKREGWVASQGQQACRDPARQGCPRVTLVGRHQPLFQSGAVIRWSLWSGPGVSSTIRRAARRVLGCVMAASARRQLLAGDKFLLFPFLALCIELRIHIQLLLLTANATIPRPTTKANVHRTENSIAWTESEKQPTLIQGKCEKRIVHLLARPGLTPSPFKSHVAYPECRDPSRDACCGNAVGELVQDRVFVDSSAKGVRGSPLTAKSQPTRHRHLSL